MRRRVAGISVPGLVYFTVLVVALVVGIIVPGGTGEAITVIAAGLLVLTIIGTLGLGRSRDDYYNRRGPFRRR